jgi:tRNA 2-thiouridine synthesizing protein A
MAVADARGGAHSFTMSHHELDARRLLCPLPVIRTQNRVRDMRPGDTLEIACTDPGALYDIPAWCRMYGHQVLSQTQQGGEIVITVRVGAAT